MSHRRSIGRPVANRREKRAGPHPRHWPATNLQHGGRNHDDQAHAAGPRAAQPAGGAHEILRDRRRRGGRAPGRRARGGEEGGVRGGADGGGVVGRGVAGVGGGDGGDDLRDGDGLGLGGGGGEGGGNGGLGEGEEGEEEEGGEGLDVHREGGFAYA